MIDKFDLKKIEAELGKKKSITEKLNYWNDIKAKYIEGPLKKFKNEPYQKQKDEEVKIKSKLFGKVYELITPLLIPEKIYNKHFPDALKNPVFTYWFLKYNAKDFFDNALIKDWDVRVKSPLAEINIKGTLKEMNQLEGDAKNLLLNKVINHYEATPYNYDKYKKEIEFLRIIDNYYETHSLEILSFDLPHILYAEHIFLKEYLENELKRFKPQLRTQAEIDADVLAGKIKLAPKPNIQNSYLTNSDLYFKNLVNELLVVVPFNQIPDYIDMYYNNCPLKGIAFYSNIIHEVPNHWASKTQSSSKKEDIFNYCKRKIDEIENKISHSQQPKINPIEDNVKSDNRYVFYTRQPSLRGDAEKFELICFDSPAVVIINEESWYVSKDKNRQLTQREIDAILFQKIFVTNVDDLTPLLDYQLNKYENKLERLNNLKTHFLNIDNFNSELNYPKSNYKFVKEHYQDHCLRWVNKKLEELSASTIKTKIINVLPTLQGQINDSIYYKLITEIKNVATLENVRVNEFLNRMQDIYDDIENELISVTDIGFLNNKLNQINNFVRDFNIESMFNQFSYPENKLQDKLYDKLWSDDYSQLKDFEIKRYQFKYNIEILHDKILMVTYLINKRIEQLDIPLSQETQKLQQKFNFDFNNYQKYVDTVNDFQIYFKGREYATFKDDPDPVKLYDYTSVKQLLTKFLMECREQAKGSDLIFSNWLDETKKDFDKRRHDCIVKKMSPAYEKTKEIEQNLQGHIDCFTHKLKLIEIIENDFYKTNSDIKPISPSPKNIVSLNDQTETEIKNDSFIKYIENINDDSKKQLFIEKLKDKYRGVGGKELAVLLVAMEREKHICIIERQRKALYDSLRNFFGWDIKSNTSINRAIQNIKLNDMYVAEIKHDIEIIKSIRKTIK